MTQHQRRPLGTGPATPDSPLQPAPTARLGTAAERAPALPNSAGAEQLNAPRGRRPLFLPDETPALD
ncbi:hypothetical protein OG455_41940 [Kitasatospora sp. NBC_01287]|uniref:hypothetical protein n=1 Tax=Kitasatospora sp. NBC_01287 TaxID=2903573 RepID=UPI002250582A|nr:hypothetical protein [Kitasatospora sp. NBC_01287]MCX4752007.1 hypothetical protein [Kitasatospora sp. NBC_01287]